MKITDLRVCPSYIGVACIDGSCPKANKEEYEEYCIPVVKNVIFTWVVLIVPNMAVIMS